MHHQRIVQLLGGVDLRPGFFAHPCDRLRVQASDVVGGLQVHQRLGADRLGAPLFGGAVIQKGIGPRIENGVRQRRRRCQVARGDADLAVLDAGQQPHEALDVHGVVQAVVQRLCDQRVVGNLAFADDVLRASLLVGEDHGQQVLCIGALELRRRPTPAVHAPHRQRRRRVPAPARAEHRRIEQRLHQDVPRRGRLQVVLHLVERKTVRRPERQHDAVFQRAGLQLEVELAAHALAQRQAPGLVDARTIGRVNDQVRVADLIEEALEHDVPLAGQHAQSGLGGGKVQRELLCGGTGQMQILVQPPLARLDACREICIGGLAQPRHGVAQLVRATQTFAQPERHGRRLPLGVVHQHLAGLHLDDAVGSVAQLEDVAGDAFEGEVLVQRANAVLLR